MGFILLITAITLLLPTFVISFVHILFSRGCSKGYIKIIDGYFKHLAIDIDIFGGSAFKSLWNAWFITKHGYKFGNKGQTMSAVFGINQEQRTLSTSRFFVMGRFFANVLNFIDKDHCKKAVANDIERRRIIAEKYYEEIHHSPTTNHKPSRSSATM